MSVSVNFKFGEGTLIGIGQNIGPRGGQDTQIVSSIFSSKGCCLCSPVMMDTVQGLGWVAAFISQVTLISL